MMLWYNIRDVQEPEVFFSVNMKSLYDNISNKIINIFVSMINVLTNEHNHRITWSPTTGCFFPFRVSHYFVRRSKIWGKSFIVHKSETKKHHSSFSKTKTKTKLCKKKKTWQLRKCVNYYCFIHRLFFKSRNKNK